MNLDHLRRIRIQSPRREERVKFLSDSDSEIDQKEQNGDSFTDDNKMAESRLIDPLKDTDDAESIPPVPDRSSADKKSEIKEERLHYFSASSERVKKLPKSSTKTKHVSKETKTLKDKRKYRDELFVEDIIVPQTSPRPSSASLRLKLDPNNPTRISLPTFPKTPKICPRSSFTRVGGGWMKTEDYLRNHVPIRVYEHHRPMSGNSYLYLKSKFVSEKDNASIVYKNRDMLLQSPRYQIPMTVNDKGGWNKYDTFIPGR